MKRKDQEKLIANQDAIIQGVMNILGDHGLGDIKVRHLEFELSQDIMKDADEERPSFPAEKFKCPAGHVKVLRINPNTGERWIECVPE